MGKLFEVMNTPPSRLEMSSNTNSLIICGKINISCDKINFLHLL